MLLVLMAILIVSSLSIALLGSLLAQAKPITLSRKTEVTINAAQAGFDAVLSQVRASTKVTGGVKVEGDATKLPCYWVAGGYSPLTGTVAGTSGTAIYSVAVTYYRFDPSNQLQAWRDDPTNQVSCTPSSGAIAAPSYALMVSTGSVGGATPSGNRTLTSTYNFSTNNTNVSGGPIHLFGTTQAAYTLCWDAGTQIPTSSKPTPPNPWQLTLNTCYSGAPQQSFQYRRDYTVVLGVTSTTDTDGYCLTAPLLVTSALTLQPCDPKNLLSLWSRQQWGRDSGQQLYVTPVKGTNYYISAGSAGATPVQGATLTLQLSSSNQNWTADSSVGPGNGGAPIGELANYSLFGSCFDVTNWDVTHLFMIVYPCKEPTPTSGSSPDQNQVVIYDSANKWLYVSTNPWNGSANSNTGQWCTVAPTTSGAWVTMARCSTTATNQKWIQGDVGSYSTAYTYVANNGLCLAAGPVPATTTSGYVPWPSVVASTCTGDATQKWNAPAITTTAGQANTSETSDGT
jgi:hypothetical protein